LKPASLPIARLVEGSDCLGEEPSSFFQHPGQRVAIQMGEGWKSEQVRGWYQPIENEQHVVDWRPVLGHDSNQPITHPGKPKSTPAARVYLLLPLAAAVLDLARTPLAA
jgi:hypothetical protein